MPTSQQQLDLVGGSVQVTIRAGDDASWWLYVTEDGIGQDLSGFTNWLCQVKADRYDAATTVTVVVDVSRADEGMVELVVDGETTAAGVLLTDPDTQWSGWWDVQAVSPEGRRRTFTGGPLIVVLDTSREVA